MAARQRREEVSRRLMRLHGNGNGRLSDSDDESDTEGAVGPNSPARAPRLAASETETAARAVDLRGMGEAEFGGEEPTPPAVTPTPRGELRRLMQTMKRLNKAPAAAAKTGDNPAAGGDSPNAKPTSETHEARLRPSSEQRRPMNLNDTSDSDSDASWLFATRTPRANAEKPRKLSSGSATAQPAEAPTTNVLRNEGLDKPASPGSPVATEEEAGEAESLSGGQTTHHSAGSVATRTTTAEVKKVRAEVGVRVPVGASAEDAVLAARYARALLARPAVQSVGQLNQEHQERRGLTEPEPEPEAVPARDQRPQPDLEKVQGRPLQQHMSQSVSEPAGVLNPQSLQPYGPRPTSAERNLKRALLLSSDSDTESDTEATTETEAVSRPVISQSAPRIPSRSDDEAVTNSMHRKPPEVSGIGGGSPRTSDRLFVPDVSLDGSFGFETEQNDHGAAESSPRRSQLPTQAVAATLSANSSQFSEDEDTESDQAEDDSERSSGDESTIYPSSARQAVPEVEPDPIAFKNRPRRSPSLGPSKSPPRNSSTYWRSRASPAGRGGMRGGRSATSAAQGPARSLSWAEDDRLEETKWLTEDSNKNNSTVWINDRRVRKASKDTSDVSSDAVDAKADAIMSAAWQQARQDSLQMSGIESFSEHMVSGRLATILSAGSQSGESAASTSGLSDGSNVSTTASEAPPPTPAYPIRRSASGDGGEDISAPQMAPLAASSSNPREGEVLSPILPAMTPVTPACGGHPADPAQQLAPVQEVMSPESAASRPAAADENDFEHHETASGTERGDVRHGLQIGSLVPSAHKPVTHVEQIERPQFSCSVRGPTPSSPQRSQVQFRQLSGSSPHAQVQQSVFLRNSHQAWEQSKPVPAVPTSPKAGPGQASSSESKPPTPTFIGRTGVPLPKASIAPPSPPAGFKISMSEYRRHGIDPSSAWQSDPKEKENRSTDVVSQVRVRPRNADVREQLQSAEFNLLDLRLAQQRGEAKVLLQQQQLLEDQLEQIALQRQQAARLGLAAVADALQPAESSIRAAAAEVLNRQQVQQEQAAAQAALVEEAGRWRRQVWAAQEAENWAAAQERNRAVAALQARCASVATDVREASRLGIASADELAAAWAVLDTASTLEVGPVGADGHEADAISEHLARVNELGETWAHRLALGAAATVANAGQRQRLLLQQELQAQAQKLMEDEENWQKEMQWQQLQQKKQQQEQHTQPQDPGLASEQEARRRMALLSPRRRAGTRKPSQSQTLYAQPQQQASQSPPSRQPLQVQTAAQTQAQAHVRRYQERFEQYQLEKAIQKEKVRENALQGKMKPPGGRHTAARALVRRRRRPAHMAAGAPSAAEHAVPMSLNANQREEAAARISSKDEEIKRIQANALLMRRKQQQEQQFVDDDSIGDAEDSPGTRNFRALLVASAAVRRSVSAGEQ